LLLRAGADATQPLPSTTDAFQQMLREVTYLSATSPLYLPITPLYLRYISPYLPTSPHISPHLPHQESALITDVITAEGGAQHGQVPEVYACISPEPPLYLPISQQVHEVYEVNDGYTSR